jgi:hypothetical protein
MPYLGRFAFTVGNFHIRNLTFMDLDHTLVNVRDGKIELDVKQLHVNVTGEYVIVRGQSDVGSYHGPLSAACTVDVSTDLRLFKKTSFDLGASISNT